MLIIYFVAQNAVPSNASKIIKNSEHLDKDITHIFKWKEEMPVFRSVLVYFYKTTTKMTTHHTWLVRSSQQSTQHTDALPDIGLQHASINKSIAIEPICTEFYYKGRAIILHQFPLIPAWASTIHIVQGDTLDRAAISIGTKKFGNGVSYVALSQVKSLDGLYLTNFCAQKMLLTVLDIKTMEEIPPCLSTKLTVLSVSELETANDRKRFYAVLADSLGAISATVYNEKDHGKFIEGFAVTLMNVLCKNGCYYKDRSSNVPGCCSDERGEEQCTKTTRQLENEDQCELNRGEELHDDTKHSHEQDEKTKSSTDIRSCLRIVVHARINKNGSVMLHSKNKTGVEYIKDVDEAVTYIEEWMKWQRENNEESDFSIA
ncbi:PIF1 [Mytilus edulis]|uniref:PIF1 n=1 Tax=Mytilus edulis TaxID=6550 RepID=A0A8S3SLG5_MYTED|nr:PIF1 [Mytilus edulis]